jgi:hypothetical protein
VHVKSPIATTRGDTYGIAISRENQGRQLETVAVTVMSNQVLVGSMRIFG